MIFETGDVYVDHAQRADLDSLVTVFNSQSAFIRRHLRRQVVSSEWLIKELNAMRDAGFWSCKVVGKAAGQVMGLADVRFDEESYLSLLMIHQDHAGRGIGQQVLNGIESYARDHHGRTLRIDVLKGYDNRVLDFWLRNGFQAAEDLTLKWNGVLLPAVAMNKAINASGDSQTNGVGPRSLRQQFLG